LGGCPGSIVSLTAGDVVVLATACIVYSSLSPCFLLLPYRVALALAVRSLFKAVIPDMHEIHPPDWSFSIVRSHNT